MKRITALAGLVVLLPAVAMAQRELFTPPTPHRVSLNGVLNTLEPAAGSELKADAHGKPASSGHGGPEATGHSSAQKSFAGKEIGGLPPLPAVKIGTQIVARQVEETMAAETASTPPELQRRDFNPVLASRISFTPFAHSPQFGPTDAPITVVIFEDLACISCTEASVSINAALAEVFTSSTTPTSDSLAGLTRVLWVHSASSRWQSSNLPAFYSKVAGQYQQFWGFRQALLNAPVRDSDSLFTMLTTLGIDPRIIRQTMLTEARRYYRELDGDVLQGKSFGIGTPPVVLVNGIRVGPSGIPLSLLPDVLRYVYNRHKAGLNEPPV